MHRNNTVAVGNSRGSSPLLRASVRLQGPDPGAGHAHPPSTAVCVTRGARRDGGSFGRGPAGVLAPIL